MVNYREMKGYEAQEDKLVQMLRSQYKGFYTFNGNELNNFSASAVKKALAALGVDWRKVKGKKWYEFHKSNLDEKIKNAIKMIEV